MYGAVSPQVAKDKTRLLSSSKATIVGAVVLATFVALLAIRLHDPQPYSGDEPHYLLVTESLIRDGDADVKNDYLTKRYLDFCPYCPNPIDPHVNTEIFTPTSPHWYSAHGVGLSALAVPAFWTAGAGGASVTMVAVALVVLILTFLWTKRLVADMRLAAIATASLSFSPFFLGLEGRMFSDLATAALLLGCLLLLEMHDRRSSHLVLLGFLVGISPWCHFKNGLVFATIAAIACVQLAGRTKGSERVQALLCVFIPAVGLLVAYELVVHDWYGSWNPQRILTQSNEIFALNPLLTLTANAFDSSRGVFTLNPALLLIAAGLPLWLRLQRGSLLRLGAVVAPTIIVQATYEDWYGGWSPAGRYMLQFLPAFVPAIALLLQQAPRAFSALAGVLLGVQWALAAAFVWLRPVWGYVGERNPFLAAVDERVGPAFDRLMPAFDTHAALVRGGWQLAGWFAVAAGLLAYGAVLSRRTRVADDSPVAQRPRVQPV